MFSSGGTGAFGDVQEVEMLPNHNGQVVALQPVHRGELLVTGAQDGYV